jgi:hypothetical protein
LSDTIRSSLHPNDRRQVYRCCHPGHPCGTKRKPVLFHDDRERVLSTGSVCEYIELVLNVRIIPVFEVFSCPSSAGSRRSQLTLPDQSNLLIYCDYLHIVRHANSFRFQCEAAFRPILCIQNLIRSWSLVIRHRINRFPRNGISSTNAPRPPLLRLDDHAEYRTGKFLFSPQLHPSVDCSGNGVDVVQTELHGQDGYSREG